MPFTHEQVGLISITYFTCPLLATAVGASLGYVALVEVGVIALSVFAYMLLTGKRYTYQDLVGLVAEDDVLDTANKSGRSKSYENNLGMKDDADSQVSV